MKLFIRYNTIKNFRSEDSTTSIHALYFTFHYALPKKPDTCTVMNPVSMLYPSFVGITITWW